MKLLAILALGVAVLLMATAFQLHDAPTSNQWPVPTRIIPTSYGTSIYNTKPATSRIIPTWPTATPWPTRVIPTSGTLFFPDVTHTPTPGK